MPGSTPESTPSRPVRDLYGFSLALNAIEDFDETLGCIVAFTQEALGCGRVSIMLLEDDVLRIRASVGIPDDVIESTRIPIGERVSGEVFRSGQAVLVKDVDALPYVEKNTNLSSKSFMSHPILYAGLATPSNPIGIINVTEREGGAPFTEADLELLTFIANTSSIAVHNQQNRIRLEAAYAKAKAQAEQLAEANERLQILQQLKGDFLCFVAHELRTPLTSLTAIDLIGREGSDAERAEVVGILRSGYERLEKLITKALEYFDWVGAGRVDTSETVDLAALVREVAEDIPGLKEPGVEFNIACEDDVCLVKATEENLEHVVGILLENALKFSPEEKDILAEIKNTADNVCLAVSDRGVGFPGRWGMEIFRPFTVADPEHHKQGTALNLATAKAIIEAFGGTIRAESGGIGKGARFVIELPSAVVAPEATHDADANLSFSLRLSGEGA